jgi:autotransporter family porin
MNKAHRVIWSSSRCAFVVTDEHGKSRGKPSSTRKGLTSAIVLGLGSLMCVPYALAAGSCGNGGASIINGKVTSTCVLASGGTLQVTRQGEIVATGPAVVLTGNGSGQGPVPISTQALVSNDGRLAASEGILLSNVAASGSLLNGTTGGINSTQGNGITLRASQLGGSINNAGTVLSPAKGIELDGSVLRGDLTNSNRIEGTTAIEITGSRLGTLRNTGTIAGTGNGSTAVLVRSSTLSGNLDNQKVVTGFYGLRVDGGSTVSGSIINKGNIVGQWYALAVDQSRVLGDISLQGSASGGADAIALTHASVDGSLINRGTVWGRDVGVHLVDSQIAGSLISSNRVEGGKVALQVQGSTLGSLDNQGTLKGGSVGLQVRDTQIAGTLRNGGSANGVDLYGVEIGGRLENAGTITGNLALESVHMGKGLLNSGTLDGSLRAYNVSTYSGGVINSGLISNQLNLTNLSIAGDVLNSGQVSSLTSGQGLAVNATLLDGNLINTGKLYSPVNALTMLGGNISGSLVNAGVIATDSGNPDSIGILLSGVTIGKNLENSGSITGGTGISTIRSSGLGSRGANTIAGDLLNSGQITGTHGAAISLRGMEIYGNLNNTGTLNGTDNGLAIDGSGVRGNLLNDGTILGGGTGILLSSGEVQKDLVNNGTITANNASIALDHSTVAGALVNAGTLNGSILLDTASVGAVGNTGVINTLKGKAIELIDSTVQSGGIKNSNVLLGSSGGLDIVHSTINGGIVNTGSMSADIVVSSGNDGLTVQKSTFNGGIVNSGTLLGNSGLIFSESTLVGNIENSGQVSGAYSDGMRLSLSRLEGDLINSASGTIIGPNGLIIYGSTITGQLINAGTLDGTGRRLSPGSALLVTDSVIGGDIINSGTLNGTTSGVNNSTLGSFVNSGTITNAYGLNFDNATIAGDIVNSGTIVGNGMDISKSVIGGQLINSGTISGRYYALHSLDGSVTRMTIAGNDTAAFIGEVSLPGASVNLAKAATYTLNDGNLFIVKDFTNNGTLRIASDANATIDGNYAQASDAVLSTEALNASTFGKLKVTGSATLPDQARFNVDVVDSGQSFSGARLNDVLSAGTLNSNGSYAVTSNSALFNFKGVKDGNSVDLVAAPKSATAVTQALQGSGNLSAARALDSGLASNGGLTPFFVGATNNAQVASAVSQTLPSNAVAATQVSQSTLSTITDVVQSRIDANTGLASGDGFYGDKNLWMKPFGSWINHSERGDSPGYDASVYGMAFGVDAPVNELLRLGVSFSYANADTNSKADVSSQSAKVDLYQLMGYGSYTVAPNTELSFHAGIGQNRNDGERNINLNGIGGKASANYDSRSVTAGVALAKAFDISPSTRFIPSVRADYTWLQDDSYSEKGSAALQPLLLKVDKHQTDQLILGLDGKLSHEIVPGTQVTGNLGIGYDVIHDDSMLTSTYAGAPGQSFNTVGQSSSPWLARGGVGVSTRIASNGTELSVNYDGEVRTDFTNQTVSLRVKMPF